MTNPTSDIHTPTFSNSVLLRCLTSMIIASVSMITSVKQVEAAEISSVVCHVENQKQSRFIQIDAKFENGANSIFDAQILSENTEVFKSQNGAIIASSGVIFNLANGDVPKNALLDNEPAKIDCMEFDFQISRDEFLRRYNIAKLPLLEDQLRVSKARLVDIESELKEQTAELLADRQKFQQELLAVRRLEETKRTKLNVEIQEQLEQLELLKSKTDKFADENRQLSLKMEKLKYSYFPYPELIEKIKSELYEPFLTALNRCWVNPNANAGDMIAFEARHETENLVQSFSGIGSLLIADPTQVQDILSRLDAGRIVLGYHDNEISVSHENIKDAAVSALERCRSDIYLPETILMEVWLIADRNGFKNIRW
jgi:hypothetical protein